MRRLIVAKSGTVAVGTVEGHERRDVDDSTFYHPVVQFVDQHGVKRRFTSVAGASSRKPIVGATVKVRYLDSNPEVAFIGGFLHMWAAPMALSVLAGVALLVSLKV